MKITDDFSDENISNLEKANLLRPLIKFFFIKEALSNTQIDGKKIESEIKDFKQKNRLITEEDFTGFLKTNRLTSQLFEQQITRKLKIGLFSLEKFSSKCEARFLDRRYFFDEVTYRLLRVESPYQARELKIRILEKEATFADLAIKYSKGFEKNSGGLIGPTSLVNAHSGLIDVLRTSQKGEITGPHQIGNWFVIIQLVKFTPAKLDENTNKLMAEELFEEWVNKEVEEMHNAIIKTNNSSIQDRTSS